MTMTQVLYALEVARCQNVSRAAERLLLSQSALSQQLRRLEQEISCRRAELGLLYRTLCREGLLSPEAGRFQNLSPPESFSAQEAACFRACVSGLGRTEAVQECERLRLYILRFEAFRAESGQLAQTRVSLSRRLGLGAGLAAAIFFL